MNLQGIGWRFQQWLFIMNTRERRHHGGVLIFMMLMMLVVYFPQNPLVSSITTTSHCLILLQVMGSWNSQETLILTSILAHLVTVCHFHLFFFSGDEQQLSNHFSFLNDEDLFASLHNMSFSANDACLDSEKPGFRGGGGGDGYWFPLAG